ncbi:DUF6354 family protein [Streptomyces sp. NPDC058861]|uniref:DUF6354 family protein n=1 Tax=Streptomyces sp. NPDC058861 TaxID=3346653 RepID=UPI003681D5AE
MRGKISLSVGRSVEEGQLYRDLDRYSADRDRRLRVGPIGPDGRAACIVEHDLHLDGALVGRTTPIHVRNLGKFELLKEPDAVAADPHYTRLLTAMAAVYGTAATPRGYARAAYDALVLQEGAA